MTYPRHTKILTTVGPATNTPEQLEKLVLAGVNAFRLNFSHGEHKDHEKVFHALRDLEAKHNRPLTILQDLQGPKIRLGKVEGGPVTLNKGETFTLDMSSEAGNQKRAPLPHPEVMQALRKGDEIYINDGLVKLRVEKADKKEATCTVLSTGAISDRKGVNLPTVDLPLSALTEKDKRDLNFGLKLGVDWVALSFVQRAKDILEAREIIGDKASIIAKIEKPNAVERIDDILEVTDAVMIARGDLGVEMPLECLPAIQRQMVQKCRAANKPVVVATQMLESMIINATPTRAEVSDVANGVYAGADCLMLSAETASGAHPLGAVEVMSRVIHEVEQTAHWDKLHDARRSSDQISVAEAITKAAANVAEGIKAKAIFTFTESGSTALRMSRQRPHQPIYMMTPHLDIARKMGLVWGILPYQRPAPQKGESLRKNVLSLTDDLGMETGEAVLVAGKPFGVSGSTNLLRVIDLGKRALKE